MDAYVTSSNLRKLLYLLTVTVVSFIIAFIFLQNAQAHWLVLSALSLALINIGNTLSERIITIAISGFLVAIAVFLSGLVSISFVIIAAYLFCLVSIAAFFSQRYSPYAFPLFLIALFSIPAAYDLIFLSLNADRTIYILAGTAIAACCQVIYKYRYIRNNIELNLDRTLNALAQLTEDTFACFLSPTYSDNLYLFERRLHVDKLAYLQAITAFREFIKANENKLHLAEKETLQTIILRFEQVFDAIIDCAQLRRRVSDHSIFEVCDKELALILKELLTLFGALKTSYHKKSRPFDITSLKETIAQFETTYQNVVQVTAREPLVFLLFIASLSSLSAALYGLDKGLNSLRHAI